MNLMKSFNKAYFFQNLKKSKGLIIFMTILIPIFTTIMLLALSSRDSVVITDLETISAINMVGLFIFPVLLSITLFSYVFKKKSVDFINSMPISKKTIFMTNTIGGIILLFFTLLVTLLLIVLVSISSTNIIFVKEICFDYLIYWFVAYTFVFAATNLAVALSGNIVTSLAVTALLLFFMPFLFSYSTIYYTNTISTNLMVKCEDELCLPDYYNCYDNKECQINKGLNTYYVQGNIEKKTSYTIPYDIFSNIFFAYNDNQGIYNLVSIIKTIILGLTYFGLGLYAFLHRKMEVCETSFKSFNLHLFIKGLTLMPIVLILYEIIDSSNVGLLIFIALIVTYYFVFDLITRKSIFNLKKSLIALFITVIVWSSYAFLVNDTGLFKRSIDTIRINSTDVSSVKINNLDTNSLSIDSDYYEDRDLINLVLNYAYGTEYRLDSNSSYSSFAFAIKLENGKEYNVNIAIPEKKYNDFIKQLSKVSTVADKVRNFNYDNTIAVYINNEYVTDKDLISLIEDSASSITSTDYYNNLSVNSFFGSTYLYTYQNNNIVRYDINGLINNEIINYMADRENEKLQDALSIKFNNDTFYININYFDSDLYNSDNYSHYIVDNMSKELYDFACEYGTENFDSTKPYAIISYNYSMTGLYRLFYTNEVEKLEKLYSDKKSELVNTDEYKAYYQSTIDGIKEKYND